MIGELKKIYGKEVYNVKPMMGGFQMLFKFKNNYGASLINHSGSYGLELAVVTWKNENFHLNYDTEITNDVLGHLIFDEVIDILNKIKKFDNTNE